MSPELDIQARNMEVTDRINDYIMKKASKLDRFLPAIEETRVELSYEKSARSASDRHIAQITVRGKNLLLRSEERADDAGNQRDLGSEIGRRNPLKSC